MSDAAAAMSDAAGSTEQHGRARARVTSSTPGRVRVRLRRPERHQHLLRAIGHDVRQRLNGADVEVNPRTGSVLVEYDQRARSHADVLSALHDLGLVIEDVAHGLGEDVPRLEGPGRTTTSQGIIETLTDLDRQLSALTGRSVDLKLAVPLLLGGLGAVQLARNGVGLGDVPAYVLLWYAFDSFWKFHREPAAPLPDPRAANGQQPKQVEASVAR
jgi:Heavy metal associated domain 2